MTRKRIPVKTADELIYLSDRKCCICKGPGKQIHHIDEHHDNNQIDNLVYLCLDHHDEATKSSGLSRKLSRGLLRKYRTELFEEVKLHREANLPMPKQKALIVSEDSVFQQAFDALVVKEIQQHLQLLNYKKWDEIERWIQGLDQYNYRVGENATHNILGVLFDVASRARNSMPGSVATSINSICRSYIYPLNCLHSPPESWSIRMPSFIDYSAAIGAALAYDGSLYLNDGVVFYAGCSLLWRSLRAAVETDDKKLIKEIGVHYKLAADGAKRSNLQNSGKVLRYQKKFARSKVKGPINYPTQYRNISWVIWE